MNKEFVPYAESLELKEVGFNEPCFGLYHNDKTFYPTQCKSHEQFHGQICSAPTFSQAFRWFREHPEWPIESWIRPFISQQPRSYSAMIWTRGQIIQVGVFSTYDEAQLNLLRKLIEIVKTKQ